MHGPAAWKVGSSPTSAKAIAEAFWGSEEELGGGAASVAAEGVRGVGVAVTSVGKRFDWASAGLLFC